MAYEYKCIGAPERAKRTRGARTRTDRVAVAMQDVINAEAVDGWEYLRTDLLPVVEKSGLFSRPVEVHRAILVFRRGSIDAQQSPAIPLAAPVAAPVAAPAIDEPSLKTPAPAADTDDSFRLAARKPETATETAGVSAGAAARPARAPSGLS